MSNDDQQPGGTRWALGEAERMMREADTPEARVLAMQRHAEAIRNMMQGELVPTFRDAVSTIIDTKVGKVAESMADSAGLQDKRFDYILRQLETHFIKEDKSRDTFARQQDEMLTELRTVSAGLGKLDQRVGAVEEGQAELAGKVSDLSEGLNETTSKVDQVDARVNRLEDRVELVESALERLSGEITEMRVTMTQVQVWLDDHPPAPEIAALMDAQDADQ